MSAESRLKCAANVRPILITDLDGNNPQLFSSVIKASVALGCNDKTIRRALQSGGSTNKLLNKYLVSDSIDT